MKRLTLGVLISGRGTNLQALIDACADQSFPAGIGLVIANRPAAGGLDRATAAGIPHQVIDHTAFPGRAEFDAAIDAALRAANVDLVCLAGFMRLLTPQFVDAWRDAMINIHPSLLPAFKGAHAHRDALAAGVRISGCTVHFVRPQVDYGPIIAQAAVPVLPSDDEASLAARVLLAEHYCYPMAVAMIANGQGAVHDNRWQDRADHTSASTTAILFNPPAIP